MSLQCHDWRTLPPLDFLFFDPDQLASEVRTHASDIPSGFQHSIFHPLVPMDKAWYSNFPTPRASPREMKVDEVAALINDPKKGPGKDYVIVDVRRTDFGVCSALQIF